MLLRLPDILLVLLAFQLLFASLFLFAKKTTKPISNRLLACFFLVLFFAIADSILRRTIIRDEYPGLVNFSGAFPLLYGPLLYLYTRSLFYNNFQLARKELLHFVPFAILFITSEVSYQVQPFDEKIHILESIGLHTLPAQFYLIALLLTIHFGIYSIASLRMIKQYKLLALNKFSLYQKVNIDWLSYTIIFFLCLFALSVANNFFEITHLEDYHLVALSGIILLLFYFVNRLLFKALNNPEIFNWVEEMQMPVAKKATRLSDDKKSSELIALEVYMKEKRPFLNPELTVDWLAAEVKMYPKDLSRLINDQLGQNFFDFVNRYRIGEAQQMLINHPDKKITVLEILYQTGFNSKSSFNTLFKKYTGVTPSEYKSQAPQANS